MNYQGAANGCNGNANNMLLTLTGSGFLSGVSTVYFDGIALATTVASSTQITACVTQAQLQAGWGAQTLVSVFNLATSSNEVTFKNGPPPMQCTANAGVLPTIRVGGEVELIGDLVIGCTVAPAPNNQAQTTTQDIVVTAANFTFTSRILDVMTAGTEALLLVGDPAPANQVLGVNVFQGYRADPAGVGIIFPGVGFGVTQGTTTNLRIVNLRANTLGFALGSCNPQNALVSVSLGAIPVAECRPDAGFCRAGFLPMRRASFPR